MSKSRSINQFTYKNKKYGKPKKREIHVVPGQAVSIKEILDKFSRGMPPPPGKEGQYFGDVDVPDFERMDKIELQQYAMDLAEETKQLKMRVKQEQEAYAKEKEELKARAEQEVTETAEIAE